MTDFENFMNLDEYPTAVLNDEEGNEIEFEKIAILPIEDTLYAIMTPALEEAPDEDEEIEIAVFTLAEGEEGTVLLTLVEDEDEADSVMQTVLGMMADEADEDEEE